MYIDDGDGETTGQELEIIPFPAIDRDMERRIEAMIARKLETPGKVMVDVERLDELEEAIDGLKRAIRAMR